MGSIVGAVLCTSAQPAEVQKRLNVSLRVQRRPFGQLPRRLLKPGRAACDEAIREYRNVRLARNFNRLMHVVSFLLVPWVPAHKAKATFSVPLLSRSVLLPGLMSPVLPERVSGVSLSQCLMCSRGCAGYSVFNESHQREMRNVHTS